MTGPVFIFGTGRSGTHSLARILASVPRTISLHEGEGTDLSGRSLDLGDLMGLNVYLYHGARREAALRESIDVTGDTARLMDASFAGRHALLQRMEQEDAFFCEANRCAYNYIDYIRKRYPDARFVHLVRNGYDCVRSWNFRIGAYPSFGELAGHKVRSTWRRYFGDGRGDGIAEHLCDLRAHMLLRSRSMSGRSLRILSSMQSRNYHLEKPVPFPGDAMYGRWHGLRRMQKLAWFWAWTNDQISERFSRLPENRRMTLRIEDLDADHAVKLMQFLDLPGGFDRGLLRPHGVGAKSTRFSWTPEDRSDFNGVAGDGMKRFGYDLQ
jgi:hypothetical protein